MRYSLSTAAGIALALVVMAVMLVLSGCKKGEEWLPKPPIPTDAPITVQVK